MSEYALALLISVAILAGLFAWVPFLHGCAACHGKLSRFRSLRKQQAATVSRRPTLVGSRRDR